MREIEGLVVNPLNSRYLAEQGCNFIKRLKT